MKAPNIKSVIQSQLDSIEMDRHLKYKTLKYIEDKSTKVHRPKWKLIGGSLGAFAACMIGLIMTQLPQSISRPESVAMLSEEGNIQTRQSTLPLEDVTNHLEQLRLDYRLGLTESNNSYTLTPIHIDDKVSYYLELSTPVDNSILCSNKEFTIIELGDNHLFFYAGDNDELEQLLLDIGTLMCKKNNHQCELVVFSAAKSLYYRPRPKGLLKILTSAPHLLINTQSISNLFSELYLYKP